MYTVYYYHRLLTLVKFKLYTVCIECILNDFNNRNISNNIYIDMSKLFVFLIFVGIIISLYTYLKCLLTNDESIVIYQ